MKFDLTGNGTKEGVELCDGAELSGNTCTGLGLGAGTLKCSANCGGFDTSNCGGTASCGNGKVDPGEACDGALLNGSRAYQNPAPSTATTDYPHGWPADPHWLLFPNTGSGFGTGAKWKLPATGGDVQRGWFGLGSSDTNLGDFQWSTLDLNGDGRPELCSPARAYQNPAPSTSTTAYPHGWPGDAHWLVFWNEP